MADHLEDACRRSPGSSCPEQRKQLSSVRWASSQALNEAIGFDAQEAIFVLAVISLSLGLINLFPFLPLDGGHIFWSLVEKVRGRRVPFSVIERASAIGFLLILCLFAIGLTNDSAASGDDDSERPVRWLGRQR